MELAETTKYMNSNYYHERFIAEYFQCKIRLKTLNTMLEQLDKDSFDFTVVSPIPFLKTQAHIMKKYLRILEVRAKLENIPLDL